MKIFIFHVVTLYFTIFKLSSAHLESGCVFLFFQTDCLAKTSYKCPLLSSAEAEIKKSLHSMLVFPVVVLIALISQSSFATGKLLPRAGASDALPDGVHPLEPYLSSQPQSSATQPEGNSPNVIRGLLFTRQLTCPRGYGLCRDGRCCPTGGLCCNAGWSPSNFLVGP